MPSKTYRPLFTRLPEDRITRWMLVKEFIDTWYQPLQPENGFSEEKLQECEHQLGFRFPAALREWYSSAGKRKDVWSTQDRLWTPKQIVDMRRDEHPSLRKFRDNLFFYCENQGCEYWMLQPRDMRLSDPPVFRTETDPRQVSPTLSAFAIQTLFREAIWRGPYRGWGGDFSISVIHEVQRSLSCSDLPELYWSAAEPIRFYEGRDIIMVTHGDAWIYIAALSEAACQSVPKVARDAMEWDQR